jgi:hypothetical protein
MFGQYSANSQGRTNPLYNVTTGKRQKTVFDTDEVPHLWAHQTQQAARNAQGNLYFNGPTIYSYGSHFPIAAHVTGKGGQRAVLFTTDKHSVTTSRHIWAVRRSLPGSVPVFNVDLDGYMLPEHDGTLTSAAAARVVAAYVGVISQHVRDAIAARTSKKIGELLGAARSVAAELARFVTFAGLPAMSERARINARKLPHIPATVDEAKDAGREAKQAAARAAKIERERKAAEYAQRIADWMTKHPQQAAVWDGTTEHAETLAREVQAAEQREAAEREQQRRAAELAAWMGEHADVSATWDGSYQQGWTLRRAFETAEREQRKAETIAAWLRGENVSLHGVDVYGTPTMLRVKGGTVETSRGANFPVAHARRGLKLVRCVMASGREWTPAYNAIGHRTPAAEHPCATTRADITLGHYRIDRITADGTVHAGCHVVTWAAIERIAPELEAAQVGGVMACDCNPADVEGHGLVHRTDCAMWQNFRQ